MQGEPIWFVKVTIALFHEYDRAIIHLFFRPKAGKGVQHLHALIALALYESPDKFPDSAFIGLVPEPRKEEISDPPGQNTAREKEGENLPSIRATDADGNPNFAVIHKSVLELDNIHLEFEVN